MSIKKYLTYIKTLAINEKRLASDSVLYILGEAMVLGISNFLLIPLLTRVLSLANYGKFVVIKTNIEFLGYILQLGILSAVSRLYFDYKAKKLENEYLSSILAGYIFVSGIASTLLLAYGSKLWAYFSPSVEEKPYFLFSVAMAFGSFFSGFVTLWLRLNQKVLKYVQVQIFLSLLLIAFVLASTFFSYGDLKSLLVALMISNFASVVILLLLFKNQMSKNIRWSYFQDTLLFGYPFILTYLAYFALNKSSLLFLQQYVPIEKIAVFGLCQQLAMLIPFATQALSKAIQPLLFSAQDTNQFNERLTSTGIVFSSVSSIIAMAGILFSQELLRFGGSPNDLKTNYILIGLFISSLVYSFTFISDSAFLFGKKIRLMASIVLVCGCLSILLSKYLIRNYSIYGALLSTAIPLQISTLLGFWFARKHVERRLLYHMMIAFFFVFGSALWLVLFMQTTIGINLSLLVRGMFFLAMSVVLFLFSKKAYFKKNELHKNYGDRRLEQ